MMKKWIQGVIFTAFIGFAGQAFAIDEKLVEKDKSQEAGELVETEKVIDLKIAKMNFRLKWMKRLWDIADTVIYTPGQTNFRKGKDANNEEYIELESYAFVPDHPGSGVKVGTRFKSMRLYFAGDVLKKVETIVTDENFRDHFRVDSRIVDPSPDVKALEEKSNDGININDLKIETYTFSGAFTETYKKKQNEVVLSAMENTTSSPLRLNFKRDYYLPSLEYFEKLFRYTFEYQKKFGTNNDFMTVEILKKSLEY